MNRFDLPPSYPMEVVRQDWRPMERHPRPLRRRNPEEISLSVHWTLEALATYLTTDL